MKKPNNDKLDKIVSDARAAQESREQGYRQQALKLFPWICGRCSREFTRENLQQLTVHHMDHNHDNNPPDGSNWELLCIYCHDNEHQRTVDEHDNSIRDTKPIATHNPFSALSDLLDEHEHDKNESARPKAINKGNAVKSNVDEAPD